MATSNVAHLPNSYSLAAIIDSATALADNETKGANAKIEFVFDLAVAAKSGMVKEGDAKEIFNAYLVAKQERAADKATIAGKAKATAKIGDNYATKTTSEWRQVIKCGALINIDGVETLNHARAVAGELGIHIYDSLITISRKQIASGNNETQFDKARVAAELQPNEEKPEITEAKELKKIIKSLEKLIKGTEATEETEGRPAFPSVLASAALAQLEERLSIVTPASDATVAFLKAQGYDNATIRAMMNKAA